MAVLELPKKRDDCVWQSRCCHRTPALRAGVERPSRSTLEWLNARTIYCYTGAYQLENDAMRMVAVFDCNSEDVKALTVIAFGDSF